ncbi:hypothetical protein OIY81_3422 [Cryptosporidium canis]|uniref:Uncharacterized protein n=1 Tax=Cryptosporidium canis TaxID=195482 RepID=A0ABQ8P384_9CRYT|nr:hypothetical protein OIY81_3422 [Cryptosporidium canis]KAJ1606520.1 hypothetical protein OJ252_3141 [Cryptosporidium canis]
MSRKVARRILDRMRRRGRRTRVRSDRNVMLDIEYSILPSIAQYSEYEDGSVSSDYSTSESTDSSHSEDEGTGALRQASTGRRGSDQSQEEQEEEQSYKGPQKGANSLSDHFLPVLASYEQRKEEEEGKKVHQGDPRARDPVQKEGLWALSGSEGLQSGIRVPG